MILTQPTIRAGRVEVRTDGLCNVHLPDDTIVYGLPKSKVEEVLDWLDGKAAEQRRERAEFGSSHGTGKTFALSRARLKSRFETGTAGSGTGELRKLASRMA